MISKLFLQKIFASLEQEGLTDFWYISSVFLFKYSVILFSLYF